MNCSCDSSSLFRLLKMGLALKFALLFGVCVAALSASDVSAVGLCPSDKSGVEYILHVRGRDYGWKGHTHRANIALAVHGYKGEINEMMKMGLQLEEEVIKALLRNQTSPINENELAMFIHALIATRRNPWDFHGLDLVGDLLHRVGTAITNGFKVHPFLVLALCNSHAVEENHLDNIMHHLTFEGTLKGGEKVLNPEDVANKAIALKAYACAASLPYAKKLGLNPLISLSKFERAVGKAHKILVERQEKSPCEGNGNVCEGKFGNVYTTSLVVQALKAYKARVAEELEGWKSEEVWSERAEREALDYLKRQSNKNVNLLQTYYIALALNSRNVTCIKDLYGGVIRRREPEVPSYYISYAILDEQNPDVHFKVHMKVSQGSNFFQVMEKARDMSKNFDFSYVFDKDDKPSVYEVIGKPNDAEQNLFWTTCRQFTVNNFPHKSEMMMHSTSPKNVIVNDRDQFILWYRSSACPVQRNN